MCDDPLHQTRRQSIAFEARSVAQIDVIVYGARGKLHSGHYGKWAPNPAMELARLLSSSKRDDGRSSVEHFYEKLAELIALPSLNIRGMASAHVGPQASNVIPSTATASIDVRLVLGMDPGRTTQLVVKHVRKQGFFIVTREPTAEERMGHAKVAQVTTVTHSGTIRTPMDLPISQEIIDVVESARAEQLDSRT